MVEQSSQAVDDIGDVTETAGLGAVAEDGNRLSSQGLANEPGHDHAVGRALPGANGVEQADDNRWKTALPVVDVGKHFVDRLRDRVGPSGDRDPAQNSVSVLPERTRAALSVDLGRTRNQDLSAITMSSLNDNLGAADVRCKR